MHASDSISDSAKQSAIMAARQYHSNSQSPNSDQYGVGTGIAEPDSGSIGGAIDRAQRVASQLTVMADHACALSDRLTGNGGTGGLNANASVAPAAPGHVDALHLAISRQEMIIQRLRGALEEIERRIG